MINQQESFSIDGRIRVSPRGKSGTYSADYNENGKHRRRSLKTRNRKEAERRAWMLIEKINTPELQPKTRAVSLQEGKELYLGWLRADGRSAKTLTKYEGELKRLIEFATAQRAKTPEQITLLMYDKYKLHRVENDGLEPYTAYNHAVLAKQWLKFLTRRKVVSVNPLVELEMRMPRRQRYPAATFQQVSAILENTSGSLFAILATLAFAGIRLGEALNLETRHIDLRNGLVHIVPTKTNRLKTGAAQRDIPIHRQLVPILAAALATAPPKPASSSQDLKHRTGIPAPSTLAS